jgi:hypothetical protein
MLGWGLKHAALISSPANVLLSHTQRRVSLWLARLHLDGCPVGLFTFFWPITPP